jgi:hypothetical protein
MPFVPNSTGIVIREAHDLNQWLTSRGFVTGSLLDRVKFIANPDILAGKIIGANPPVVTRDSPLVHALSEDQIVALEKLEAWLSTDDPYFILCGYAGTGKDFLMGILSKIYRGINFSATTNKASKVLGSVVGTTVKTIYSLLGLRMVEDDDRLVLRQSDHPPHFSHGTVIVVNEASMVGIDLMKAIDRARVQCGIRVIYVGDPAQLPPVGESRSPVWRHETTNRIMMKQVMRNDNELLRLATRIRRQIRDHDWSFPIKSDGNGVVLHRSKDEFERELRRVVRNADLHETKVISWRNRTVNEYNCMIRDVLGRRDPYCVGDVILLAEPIERDGVLVAHTDDEFTIDSVTNDSVDIDTVSGKMGIATWSLFVRGSQNLQLQVPQKPFILNEQLSAKASIAKRAKGRSRAVMWRDFWDTKRRFHSVRYGYALTAHRSQGSSYKSVWVDTHDILANHDSREAFRCLYVAVTRPTTSLHSY